MSSLSLQVFHSFIVIAHMDLVSRHSFNSIITFELQNYMYISYEYVSHHILTHIQHNICSPQMKNKIFVHQNLYEMILAHSLEISYLLTVQTK